MMNRQKSSKIGRNPSFRQLFPPKLSNKSINTSCGIHSIQLQNQCCHIVEDPKQVLLPEVPQRNEAPILSSPTLQQAVSIHISSAQPCSLHVHDEFADESFPSPETVPSSFATFRDKTPMNLNMYMPLYRAALKGDWEKAKEFLSFHPGAVRARITKGLETALHIAAGARRTKFVEELVKMMSAKDIAIQNSDNNTALCFAAASGITRIAEVMVKKNEDLPGMRGSKGVTPLYIAALLGHRDMVWYLYSVTDGEDLLLEDYVGLLVASITTDLFGTISNHTCIIEEPLQTILTKAPLYFTDVALDILQRQPELALHHGLNGETPLLALARKPLAFASGSQLGIWERCIYPWIHVELIKESRCPSNSSRFQTPVIAQVPGIKAIYEKKLLNMQALELVKRLWEEVMSQDESQFGDLLRSPSKSLFIATEFGIVEFVTELLYSYPDLIWKVDDQKRSLFHIAVVHRQEKIFSLIYDIGAHKDLITSYTDDNNHNMLHLAGKLAPSDQLNVVSGAALQMQRELLWFKEVEKIVQPLYKEMRDPKGRTPQMLFIEEHKDLVKGEKWMKNTASSCMLVATLITTVMFAAIFTVPGGNKSDAGKSDEGTPIFLKDKTFTVFAVSDAFALFSSVTSVLIFLSILTSRYAEQDFLKSLPQRLSIGIATLFLSIVTMLIAFGATFFIVLGHHLAWIVIPMALIACIPVILFAFLQFPLLADVVHFTYGSGIFAQKSKYAIY